MKVFFLNLQAFCRILDLDLDSHLVFIAKVKLTVDNWVKLFLKEHLPSVSKKLGQHAAVQNALLWFVQGLLKQTLNCGFLILHFLLSKFQTTLGDIRNFLSPDYWM